MAMISLVGGGILGNLCTDTQYFHYLNSRLNPVNAKVMQATASVLGSASALAAYNMLGHTVEQKVMGTATLICILSAEGALLGFAGSHQNAHYLNLGMSLLGPMISGIAVGILARKIEDMQRA